jgi:hypothetical protein
MANNLEFYLSALNSEITADAGTLDGDVISEVDLAEDAVAVLDIPVATARATFKFQSDSLDFTDTAADDIKYYVYYDGTGVFSTINPALALVDAADSLDPNAAAGVRLVKHDFVRHLALKLFNTIHGVDLFSNEAALLQSVEDAYADVEASKKLGTLLTAVSTGSGNLTGIVTGDDGVKYMLGSTTSDGNICRTIFRKIIGSDATRLIAGGENIADTADIQSVPLKAGDYFVFKLTVNSSSTQTSIIGADPGAATDPRVYKIKLNLV